MSFVEGYSVLSKPPQSQDDGGQEIASVQISVKIKVPGSDAFVTLGKEKVNFASQDCKNILSDLHYDIVHNGAKEGIVEVIAYARLKHLPNNQKSRVMQTFSYRHLWAHEQHNTTRRSGNPGYLIGKPLIFGISSRKSEFLNSANKEETQSEDDDLIMQTSTLSAMNLPRNGNCFHSTKEERRQIKFGENVLIGCTFTIALKDFENRCESLKNQSLSLLLGEMQHNANELRVASFGNPNFNKFGRLDACFAARLKLYQIKQSAR